MPLISILHRYRVGGDDSLDLKIQLAARRLSADVADHFLDYGTVAEVLRRVRAFGPIECLAQINNLKLFVRRVVGWTEAHAVPVGTVVHANGLSLVVAVADGFIGLTEWSLIQPDAVIGSLRR